MRVMLKHIRRAMTVAGIGVLAQMKRFGRQAEAGGVSLGASATLNLARER